jgi:hypothetical protein
MLDVGGPMGFARGFKIAIVAGDAERRGLHRVQARRSVGHVLSETYQAVMRRGLRLNSERRQGQQPNADEAGP